jgi:MoaA/NifB/PqqE/SkfB family radical SAM enzyme
MNLKIIDNVNTNKNALKYNPFMLIVDQTVRCNEACYFCWRNDPKKVKEQTKKAEGVYDMPMELVKEIIDQGSRIPSLHTFNVCGPMGDPTMVGDMAERGRYARIKGFQKTMMNTNAVALDKHDPEELLRAFNEVKVSLDTLDADNYKEIHGKPHLERVLNNIVNYWEVKQKKNIPGNFKAKITLNEKNEPEVEDFKKWAEKTGVPIEWKSIHSFIDIMPQFGNDIGMKLCEQPYKTININFKGELTTCCINYKLEPAFGKVGVDGSIKEIWEGEKFEQWRKERTDGICKGCAGLGGRLKHAEVAMPEYERLGEKAFNERY